MITRTPGLVEVYNVMWQPIYRCIMGCSGCYVADSPSSKYKGKPNTEIIDLIYKDKKVICQQFTISLDTILPKDIEDLGDLLSSIKALWNIYKEADDCGCNSTVRKSIEGENLPQLCVTAYNYNTIRQWYKAMNMTEQEFLAPLTLLSLSNFPSLEKNSLILQEKCKASRTLLNFNCMVTEKTAGSRAFRMGYTYADQVYLVLKKSPLGSEQAVDAIRHWFEAKKEVPKEKLMEDACLQDTVILLKDKYKCGAGINKVHIWPDGSVSGCPYDAHHIVTKIDKSRITKNVKANTWTEIQKAVLDRTCHSMDFCKIPQAFTKLIKQKKNAKESCV